MVKMLASKMIERLPEQKFGTVFEKIAQKTKNGANIMNLGQGNPDLPTPAHIVSALQESAGVLPFQQYAPFRGFDFFKQAIADFYRSEFGAEIDPQKEIALFTGGKTGLYVMSQCLLDPGDIALVPDPGYPEYHSGILMADAKPYSIKLEEKNGYLPDLSSIDPDIVKKAKVLFLNYPNNPTGAVANEAFFEEVAAFAAAHELYVIHDFAYGSFHYEQTPVSFMNTPLGKSVGVELYSLSKTFNMAGWRVAFAVGNEEIIQAINTFQDHVFVSMYGGFQHAATAALQSDDRHIQSLRAIYLERINFFIRQAARKLGWTIERPPGAFYLWAPIPDDFEHSHAFADYLLEHADVVVTPGGVFGANGSRHVRISMVAPIEELALFIDRLSILPIRFHQKTRQ
ncbi:aminotransferase class I/II-fold pyridoxal phosphate-dependent enzyme [Bacillus altitudinis]|nr:aminotransferase class I/II-fold pyridoxal phosphate-dependent enzyme [Bacillus altitudinis]MDI6559206.1 aminotransferase class I/II-fold pyridoxal phosphate-dependent enzyme [Bacillus altitudinis]MDI6645705.1 aminotransferase class I/II-fold pyridoxal phosphate-dependent enzyme [Bacillus altitudinis]MDI6660374.1 aminotransferase class I/II-fold pyridoxal phosphate-dependent enzyme [Bacillus altitudinis]MED0851391.1 aminotransferase class I/II-fold pyridoxal phosphate-dependent enzyme [Bacil